MRALILTILLTVSPTAAAITAEEAEQIRLTEEMRTLARRNIWVGVDRMYRHLSELGAELTSTQHLQGAHAAQDLGDIQSCYERLRSAARLEPTKEVIDWLWAIDTAFGEVEITAAPGVTLSAAEQPLDAVHRKAIEKAAAALQEDGRFVGRLPAGHYSVGGEVLEVTSGRRVALAL